MSGQQCAGHFFYIIFAQIGIPDAEATVVFNFFIVSQSIS
jgi:hypothetical protein